MPKVSVIIPIYNAEKYLKRCLDSILCQTFCDFEIICVNDCSSDKSGDILENYAKSYGEKIITLNNEVNMHAGLSKDKALLYASGEFIIYIDSDDYIAKDYIEKYVKCIEEHNSDIVVGGYIRDAGDEKTPHPIKQNIWAISTYVVAWSKMYRKEFILNNKMEFTSLKCLEDMHFNLMGFCNEPRYYVLDYQGYYYCYNEKSITNTFDYNNNHELFVQNAFDNILSKCNMEKMCDEYKWVLQYTYVANMINSLITYNKKCGYKNMQKKYVGCMKDLKSKFPDYKKNPYFKFSKSKGQQFKIRIAVSVMMMLNKIGLDKYVYCILSC